MDKLEDYLLAQGPVEAVGARLLREVVYDRLYDAIRNTRLQPGDALSEPRIARALGISRTPVREALHLLTQAGLLETIPGRAVLVASPSMRNIFDSLQVRELLEPEMMKAVALTMAAGEIRELLEITAEMERAAATGDRPGWSRADNQWHELMSRACPNRLLGELVLQTRNRIFITAADENVTDQYLIDGTQEHKKIVAAIEARDGELARQLTLNHITNLKADMIRRYNLHH
ncbi:MAG: GntR family transcriptional regulator [Anaerolineae bacterium]